MYLTQKGVRAFLRFRPAFVYRRNSIAAPECGRDTNHPQTTRAVWYKVSEENLPLATRRETLFGSRAHSFATSNVSPGWQPSFRASAPH